MKKNIQFLIFGIFLGIVMGIVGAWSVGAKFVQQTTGDYVKYFQQAGDMARVSSLYKAKSNLYFLGLCHEKRYSELEAVLEKGLPGDLVQAGDLNRSENSRLRGEYERIAMVFKSYYLMKGIPIPSGGPVDLFLKNTPPGDPAAFKAFMEKPDL